MFILLAYFFYAEFKSISFLPFSSYQTVFKALKKKKKKKKLFAVSAKQKASKFFLPEIFRFVWCCRGFKFNFSELLVFFPASFTISFYHLFSVFSTNLIWCNSKDLRELECWSHWKLETNEIVFFHRIIRKCWNILVKSKLTELL